MSSAAHNDDVGGCRRGGSDLQFTPRPRGLFILTRLVVCCWPAVALFGRTSCGRNTRASSRPALSAAATSCTERAGCSPPSRLASSHLASSSSSLRLLIICMPAPSSASATITERPSAAGSCRRSWLRPSAHANDGPARAVWRWSAAVVAAASAAAAASASVGASLRAPVGGGRRLSSVCVFVGGGSERVSRLGCVRQFD
jgi:hypothetical protein